MKYFIILLIGFACCYDYYMFQLEVPYTVCNSKDCESTDMGKIPPKSLNLHGLWPSSSDGDHPFSCMDNIYNETLINSDLLALMNVHWVGLYNSTYWFRYHEYGKHGTCFKDINRHQYRHTFLQLDQQDQVQQMNDFFKTTIDLKMKINFESVFFNQSYIDKSPKNNKDLYKFPFKELMRNLQASYPNINEFFLVCKYDDDQDKAFVQSISVCLDLQLRMIDCSKVTDQGGRSNCQQNDIVYMETLQKSNLVNQLDQFDF